MPTTIGNDVRVRLKGINTVRRRRVDGSEVVYRYHRATGVLLKGEPGSPEFIARFADAERFVRTRGEGTISAGIRRFEDSPEFGDMAATTIAEYRRKLKIIDKKWGITPLLVCTAPGFRRDVMEWRDKIAKRAPREADNLVSGLARVLAFLVGRGELGANILDKIPRVYSVDRSDKLWLPEHVAAFTAMASIQMRQAMMIALHTGQRQADILRLTWANYDGERITLTQSKTKKKGSAGRVVSIKCTSALKAMLDEMKGDVDRVGPILTTPGGRSWKKRYFAEKWQEACEAAKIAELHFHDLRGTAVTMLAEAGCTVPEIAAITGHTLAHAAAILEKYLARTSRLADAAILKLEQRRNQP